LSNQTISIDPQQVIATVTTVVERQEGAVEVKDLVEGHGTSAGPAHDFKWTLDYYVTDIKRAMLDIKSQLEKLQKDVTDTITELGEKDAALADEASTFIQGVDAVALPESSGSSTKPTGSADDAAKATAIG
jgi:hypothetical protein